MLTDNKLQCLHESNIIKDYDDQEIIERFYLSSVNVLTFSVLLVSRPITKSEINKVHDIINDYIFKSSEESSFVLNSTNEEITIVLFKLSTLEADFIVSSIENVIMELFKRSENTSMWGNGRVSGIIKDADCLKKYILEAKRMSLLDIERKMTNNANFSFGEIKYLIEKNRTILNDMIVGEYGKLDYNTILEMSEKLDKLLVEYYNVSI